MNPSIFVSGGVRRSDPECRGSYCSCLYKSINYSKRWSGGRWPCAKMEGLPYLSLIHSCAASVACTPSFGLSEYNCLTARVCHGTPCRGNERKSAVRVQIKKKSLFCLLTR